MTVGNIDYTKWQPITNQNTVNSTVQTNNTNNISIPETESDTFVSQSGEKCTDGKDDGKIGLGSAIWNTIKGVGKTAVNMVKGCFTDGEGKFSLGKTLLSVGTAALCFAFPGIALAACGIGAVAGAVQVGKGVYNALTADNDAEAKLAWQNVGGGALTTGLSIAGAKASYNAVMNTTTVGATAALKEQNPNAGILLKGKALLQDMWSSTKNRGSNIGETLQSINPLKKDKVTADNPTNKPETLETSVENEPSKFSKLKSELKDLNDMAKLDGKKSAPIRAKLGVISENYKTEFASIVDLMKEDGIIDKNPVNTINKIMEIKPELVEKYGYDNLLAIIETIIGAETGSQSI